MIYRLSWTNRTLLIETWRYQNSGIRFLRPLTFIFPCHNISKQIHRNLTDHILKKDVSFLQEFFSSSFHVHHEIISTRNCTNIYTPHNDSSRILNQMTFEDFTQFIDFILFRKIRTPLDYNARNLIRNNLPNKNSQITCRAING